MVYTICYKINENCRKFRRYQQFPDTMDEKELLERAKRMKEFGIPQIPGPLHKVYVFKDKSVFIRVE